jgi:hypothetical protein
MNFQQTLLWAENQQRKVVIRYYFEREQTDGARNGGGSGAGP